MPTALIKLWKSGVGFNNIAFIGINETSKLIAKIMAKAGKKVYVLAKKNISDLPPEIKIIPNVISVKAEGKNKVRRLVIKTKDGVKRIDVDFVVFSAFENPDIKVPGQAGLRISYIPDIGFVTLHDEALKAGDNIFVVGRASGTMIIPVEISEAQYLGEIIKSLFGVDNNVEEHKKKYFESLDKYGLSEKKKLIYRLYGGEEISFDPVNDIPTLFTDNPNGHKFVCFCEDATLKDIHKTTLELNMNRFEMLKRYVGVATGRCQGRGCLINTVFYMSKITGKDPNYIGLMRQRPPLIPVPLRVFSLGVGDVE